ncbi:MAG: hypothetical protein LC135_04635 [Phycisphaerae bacterium]|nr:hypothetical protein [Phycisphaerae bacterium]MCZ2399141.1 hypothetical protein [Phycisphaerae bacterium]NUQ50973.1 hypothetical protein [Phycisphaerae bacterium]
MRSLPHPARPCLVVVAVLALAAPAYAAKTIKVKNNTGHAVTLSDFYTFTDEKNSQGKKELMKKGDASDDINIAAGGEKNISVEDNVKSITISWLNSAGKEVETDAKAADFTIEPSGLAMFTPQGYDGLYAMISERSTGPLPPEGSPILVVDGKIAGGLYDWITFYDATASDGDILRDPEGNPISPLLSGVTMTTDFNYELLMETAVIPSASQWGLMALLAGLLAAGAIVAWRRERGLAPRS